MTGRQGVVFWVCVVGGNSPDDWQNRCERKEEAAKKRNRT